MPCRVTLLGGVFIHRSRRHFARDSIDAAEVVVFRVAGRKASALPDAKRTEGGNSRAYTPVGATRRALIGTLWGHAAA